MSTKARTMFTIITPCFNAEQYIAETVNSVLKNTAVVAKEVNLEYIVCDGGSNDNTTSIIHEIFEDNKADNIFTTLISEQDNGMYDALAKGLKMAKGDIIAYINAGDFYAPTAFVTVNYIFKKFHPAWLTGLIALYSEKSELVGATVPTKYSKRFIRAGLYGRILPYIQQESTFWQASLNSTIDYGQLSKYKLAGDYYLWKSFAETAELKIVQAWLGGFKYHAGQKSKDKRLYFSELKTIAEKPTLFDYLSAYSLKYLLRVFPAELINRANENLYKFDFLKNDFVV